MSRYVYLPLPNGQEIHVKLDDEGVVIDLWEDGEVIESTYEMYQEMGYEVTFTPMHEDDL
jgi:hypothetical protein